MTALSRATTSTLRSTPRTCLASTSRLPLSRSSRPYATESQTSGAEEASERKYSYGTTVERREQGPIFKTFKGKGVPHLNSSRHTVIIHHPHLWKGGPLRELTSAYRRKGGRDATGQIAVRHIGGGHKRRLRMVDFWRFAPGIHDVVRIEYDPGRSAHIALIRRRDGSSDVSVEEGARLAEMESIGTSTSSTSTLTSALEGEKESVVGDGTTDEKKMKVPREAKDIVKGGWSYILAPDGLRAGDTVRSFRTGVPTGIVEGWGMKTEDEAYDEYIQSGGGDQDTTYSLTTTTNSSAFATSTLVSPRSLGLFRAHAVKPGNVLPLYLIPAGTVIHNISFDTGGKMRAARSAGSSATIVTHQFLDGTPAAGTAVFNMGGHLDENGNYNKVNGWVHVKMVSGEVRRLAPSALATVGRVSNVTHNRRVLGKAGRARWLGRRPRTRGVAMNSTDHPLGGGRGKTKGNKQATSIWGWTSKGRRTRRPKDKHGNKMVVFQRPRGPHSRKGGV